MAKVFTAKFYGRGGSVTVNAKGGAVITARRLKVGGKFTPLATRGGNGLYFKALGRAATATLTGKFTLGRAVVYTYVTASGKPGFTFSNSLVIAR